MIEPIAIVGMACIFPKAPDLKTYWKNICDGVDAITQVPVNRIDPCFFDPQSRALERLYCRRGGFIDEYAKFDPIKFRIMPNTATSAEPDQPLALEVSSRALKDAGYRDRQIPHRRTGVILGRGAYMASGVRKLETHVHGAEQLVVGLRSILPGIDEQLLDQLKQEYIRKIDAPDGERIIGLIPNLCASRIAHYYDFKGPAYTVDAACASSLLAVEQGCHQLLSGQTDMMLCGGVHLTHFVSFWAAFSQLRALSRKQVIRPFDTRADGTLLGEGVGVLVLRREKDALRDGQRIYARIKGIGSSSDGGGQSLISPNSDGQFLALESAWHNSGLQPDEIGLIEAHGTGTQIGDPAEVETLRRFFGPPLNNGHRAGLGTVKSMIGHTMPASGAAGLIKAALAVHHSKRPCSLNCDQPLESLEHTRFRILQETESWEDKDRIAAVNAFGFGGINVHIIIDNARNSSSTNSFALHTGAQLERKPDEPQKDQTPNAGKLIDLSLGGMTLFSFDKPLPLAVQQAAFQTDSKLPVESNSDDQLEKAFHQVTQEMLAAQSEVLEKFKNASSPWTHLKSSQGGGKVRLTKEISLQTIPELIDHSFYRQAPGWTELADLQPLVPMTGLIELMKQAASEIMPDHKVIAMEDVQAIRWLRVDKPVEATITCSKLDDNHISVSIEGYAQGIAVLSTEYPKAPGEVASNLKNERPAPITAEDIYRDHWLFHGPRYQGIKTFGPMADDGMCGELEETGALGELLDCAGQIFGLWIVFNTEVNRVALPIRIDHLRFYAPYPAPGERVQCTVRIREMNQQIAKCDISVSHKGKCLVAIEGWQDLRLPIDDELLNLIHYPEKSMLSKTLAPGFVLFHDVYTAALSRETLANRYLREVERKEAHAKGPRGNRIWTSSCVVAKDAVRSYLWSKDNDAIFPAEIWITEGRGQPVVAEPKGSHLNVCIAHQGNFFVAMAAEDASIFIHLEEVRTRSKEFEQDHFGEEELEFLNSMDREEWLTRMWTAKQTFAKASDQNKSCLYHSIFRPSLPRSDSAKSSKERCYCSGFAKSDRGKSDLNLDAKGNIYFDTRPKWRNPELDSGSSMPRIERCEGESFLVAGTWISTHRFEGHIIGWLKLELGIE